MKIAIIIQARMSSTRLPGKVLKQVLNKPLLDYQIDRLKRCQAADEIIIATTEKEADQPIVDFCKNKGINFFRGSEDDVLARYYYSAKRFNADYIVRITSDCPVVDPKVVDNVINHYINNKKEFDFASNTLIRTYPRGMDTAIIPFPVLEETFLNAKKEADREHVATYIYTQPEKYRLLNYSYYKDCSSHRWTVDTVEDFELISKIIENLYPSNPEFTLEDVVQLMDNNPSWKEINAHVAQKKVDL